MIIRTHLAYRANVEKSCYMKQQSHSSESVRCYDVNCNWKVIESDVSHGGRRNKYM